MCTPSKEELDGRFVGAFNSTLKAGLYFRENRSYKYEIPQLPSHPFSPKPIHESTYVICFSKEAMVLLSTIKEILH